MKKLICILLCLFLCFSMTVMAEKSTNIFEATDPHIRYIGRWVEDDGMMRGYFEGQIVVRFTGTSLACAKKSGGAAAISVDGGDYVRHELSGTLAKNLTEGEHTASIVAFSQRADVHLSGFVLDEGAALLETEEKTTVEFIGDSILEGYIPGDNTVLNSYGHLVGEQKGWYRNVVAFGGITLTAGHGNPDTQGMVKRYFVRSEYNPEEDFAQIPAWDTACFTPDYIVINLGTNDNGVSDSEFTLAGMAFLDSLRKAYAQAKILVLIPFTQNKAQAWRNIVKSVNDPAVMLVETKDWNVSLSEDNLHPDAAGHATAAQKTVEALDNFQSSTVTEAPSSSAEAATTSEATPAPKAENKKKSATAAYVLIPVVIVAGTAAALIAVAKKKKKKK